MRLPWPVAIVVATATAASADPRPMSAGRAPVPTTSAEVAIAREDLTIDVSRKEAAVTAVLELENRGPDAKLTVGFPCDASLAKEVAGLSCKTKLDVRVGDRKVAARLAKGHWTWPMTFAAGQTTRLTVAYRAPLVNDRYQTPYFGMGVLYYRLTTGAAWAGPIGALHMAVRLPSDAILHVTPAGYTRDRGVITWDLKDFEPTEDVTVLVHPMWLGRYAGVLKANTAAELGARIDKGDFSAVAMDKLVAEMRRNTEDIVKFAEFFHKVAMQSLSLPRPPEPEVRETLEASLKMMEATATKGKRDAN